MSSSFSIVEFMSEHKGYSCGYCKSPDTNHSNGMWAHVMTVQDYQDLIDIGWRRSGQYCYKPSMKVTCCPLYTIKCEALNVKLTKSQKKILKRMHRFLDEGEKSMKRSGESEKDDSENGNYSGCRNDVPNLEDKALSAEKNKEIAVLRSVEGFRGGAETLFKSISGSESNESYPQTSQTQPRDVLDESLRSIDDDPTNKCGSGGSQEETSTCPKSNLKTPRTGVGRDFSKPECKKAKLARWERKQKKLQEKGMMVETSSPGPKKHPVEKSLEDFLAQPISSKPAHNLEFKLVGSMELPNDETFEEEFHLYQRYQVSVHRDPLSKCTQKQFTRFLVCTPLKVRLVPSNLCESELESVVWPLYVRYQMNVHNETEEETSYKSFYGFLVASPLKPWKDKNGVSYGSFHQQYWLDGKLIAVGVIDILPRCVSSVYFFYDPDYAHLTLGTYGSLREVAFVRSLQRTSPELCHYYMGYYVHSCPKMRYKARLLPSFLLCPETYTWVPVEKCIKRLDASKYSKLDDAGSPDPQQPELEKVLVLWERIAMPYSRYKQRKPSANDSQQVLEYATLVGRACSERMLLFRD